LLLNKLSFLNRIFHVFSVQATKKQGFSGLEVIFRTLWYYLRPMKLTDFHYDLPEELIASYPLKERSASRLMQVTGDKLTHGLFTDLPTLINENDLLIFNNTKVIPARLRGEKDTGGKIEMLVERILDDHRVLSHVRASKSPKPGSQIIFNKNIHFEMLARVNDLFELRCLDPRPVLEIIEELGEIPLPPYMNRNPEESDIERYQTIYADPKGSVAAPTAGLHFDNKIMQQIKAQTAYLTLHVGSGTFLPVRTENILEHHMHAEYLEVSEDLCEKIKTTKSRGGRVIAVGTTSARALETASESGEIKPFKGDTQIFIYPGFKFNCVDALITNFHLPESTLLMLVCAFGGYENLMRAYHEAVREKYRFFSYGDAMFILSA